MSHIRIGTSGCVSQTNECAMSLQGGHVWMSHVTHIDGLTPEEQQAICRLKETSACPQTCCIFTQKNPIKYVHVYIMATCEVMKLIWRLK